MKYKILSDQQLFHTLHELYRRGKECQREAHAWITRNFGSSTKYAIEPNVMWGGIAAIELTEKPEGWRSIGKTWQRLYCPKANQKSIWKEWNALPVVKQREVNDVIQYGEYSGWINGVMVMTKCPGFVFAEEYILVEISEVAVGKYKPVEGMVEITVSEFMELKSQFETA